MKISTKVLMFPVLLGGLVLAACSGSATPAPATTQVPVVNDNFAVVAEGKLLPYQYASLSFTNPGKVAEVLVKKGDTVAADAVIARLENSEALKAQVVQAQTEILNAQQAIDTLNRDVQNNQAKAQYDQAIADKALDDAQRRLKNLNYPDLKWWKDEIEKAQDAVTTAQENVTVVDIGSLQAALQAAHDSTKDLKEHLDKVQTAVNGCPTCDATGVFTVDHITETLQDATDNYNDGLNRIKTLEIQIAQAQRGNSQTIKDAQKHLDDTMNNYNAAIKGPKPLDQEKAEADVVLAQAQKKDAEDRLAKWANGPDPDLLASAQARLATAQANLAAAQDAFTNSEIHAPFAGVIADLTVKVGEQASPAQPAVVLADFSKWIVETDNLTEIEVVKVSQGQKASIVLDALPDVTLHGVVTSISPVFEEKRGDVTYTVTVQLSDGNDKMRWGMTAVTTFEK